MVILGEEVLFSPSPPSCSFSSSAVSRWKYDVFLSFRGKDTRKGFTDHLYTALKQKGIHTFRDDKRLETGKPISPELLKAIEESRFAVIVFSRNYAGSTWCLDELAKIVECMKETGLTVFPIFYDVTPSEVRHQTGTFASAFAKHKKRFKENIENVERWRSALREVANLFRWCMDELAKIVECMSRRGVRVWTFYHVDPSYVQRATFAGAFAKHEEKVKIWRAALKEVANLSGCELGERHESKILQEIVEKIFMKLHDKIPRATEGLVGIDNQVEELNCLLCIGSNDVRVIGIWGMGGIGKTTLAKVVYDIYSSDFEGCSFIKNVKDASKESDFVQLQQQLLYEILKEKNMHIWTVESGVNVIKNRLRGKKILLVLDDVNHLDQLKYLAEKRDWFGSGSRIIITTRDQHLLNARRVDEIHECKELNNDDALELFCLKAFEKEHPKEGYEEISQKIVSYTNRLPLALDVLGSFFAARGKEEWEDALKRLNKYPNEEIIKNLEISYDGLGRTEQEIFIYIACCLKGRNQGLVIDILESLHLHPTIGMDVLIKKSLITISNEIVLMHDLLQEMGWEILYKQSPTEPGNRKGIRLREDILDVLKNNEGTKTLEIINQEPSMEEMEEVENCTCNPEAFSKMRRLRFLQIHNVYFPQGIEYLSNELRILEWHGYPSKSLPLGFLRKEIRELHIRYSQIEELWEGAMFFPNLRSIDLSCSENLIKTPDLTETPRLEELHLRGCTNLVQGHSSILVHKKLNYLNMAGCISLENLPTKIEMESLKTLILSNCSKVKRIPEFGENMKCLEGLYLDGTAIEELPLSIKHLTCLKDVSFSRCSELGKRPENLGEIECLENLDMSKTVIAEIQSSMAIYNSNLLRSLGNLCCLEGLNLSWCNLSEIPNAICCLFSLKYLSLDGNNFVTLPASISQLSKLKMLDLSDCKRLQSLLALPSQSDLPLRTGHVTFVDIGNCTSLETLPQLLQISELGKRRKHIYYLSFTCMECPKLIENDNSVAIVKSHLQGPNGRKFPFFTTTFGGRIPQWFTHQRVGNCVSVELPPNWCDSRWMGFSLCAHFPCSPTDDNYWEIKVSVFATMLLPDLQCIYPPEELILNSKLDSQAVWYMPKDKLFEYIDCCNQWSGRIIFYFETKADYFMECGVRLVYMEDVEELIQTTYQASGSNIPPSCLNCPKLIGNENDISVVILKRCLQECGFKVPLFKTIFIQGDEIPQWFTHQNVGNSISIELPPNWCDSTLLGFALYAHFDVLPNFQTFVPFNSKTEYVQRFVSVSVTFVPDVIQHEVFSDRAFLYKDEVYKRV